MAYQEHLTPQKLKKKKKKKSKTVQEWTGAMCGSAEQGINLVSKLCEGTGQVRR